MSETGAQGNDPVPAPRVRQHAGLSLVWLIPLLPALIGGWLIYRTIADKGPLVTIGDRAQPAGKRRRFGAPAAGAFGGQH